MDAEQKISKEEKLKRIELYNLKQKEIEDKKLDSKKKSIQKFEKETSSDKNKILERFQKILLFKNKIKISIDGEKFYDSTIYSIDRKEIKIKNPFHMYPNQFFPEKSVCYIEHKGFKNEFHLKKIKMEKDNIIVCDFPNTIEILKTREHERIYDPFYTPIGIFLKSKKIEFIGYVKNICRNGVGFYINDVVIDNDSLSRINKRIGENFPIIIDNGKHIPLIAEIKYIRHNKNKKRIEMGAELKIEENSKEEEEIISIIEKFKTQNEYNNKVNQTYKLINKIKRTA